MNIRFTSRCHRLFVQPQPGEAGAKTSQANTNASPTMKNRYFHALLATSLAVGTANAQTTTPPPLQEETVTLSTFTVNADKDSGYQASDTIVGGRLKTNLLKTPTDISVLTREFLDDLAVTDMAVAGNWLAGSDRTFPNDVGAATDFGAKTGFRSLGAGTDTRNGFRTDSTIEPYAVERMEGARGSNAILFGDAPSGGQTNFTTKMARFRDSTDLTLRAGSTGTRAVYVDFNRRLSPQLAARVNIVAQQSRNWLDRDLDDRYGITTAVTYRPWKNGELRFDGGFDYSKRTIQERFADQTSKWDGVTTVAAPLTANPAAATGVGRFTADKMVWIPALSHLFNFNGFGQTTGSALNLVDDTRRPVNFPVLQRREFFLAPPDEFLSVHTRTATLFFNQSFQNGISLEMAGGVSAVLRNNLSYNLGNIRRDVNQVLPRLPSDATSAPYQANPNFGKFYTEGTYAKGTNDQVGDYARTSLAYDFKRFRWFRQIMGVNASNRTTWFYPNNTQYGRTNGTNPDRRNGANQIVTWRYWDNPALPANWPAGATDGANIGTYLTRDQESWQRIQTLQFSTVGYYFDEKLSLVAGWRRDRFSSALRNIGTYNSVGEVATYTYDKPPIRYNSSQSIGLTFFPIKAVGVYANTGGGLQQGGSSSAFLPGRTVFFSHSKTWSGGLRMLLWDGKVVARIGGYDSKDRDRAVNLTLTNINAIWGAMGHPEKNIQSPFSSFADTLDYHGWGKEAEVTLNVTKKLRLTANVSLPRTQQVNARQGAIAYIGEHRQEWENAAKGLDVNGAPLTGTNAISPAGQTQIATQLPAVYDLITGAAEGRTLDGTHKYRANFFGVYELPGERIKGLSVGGGANLYGKRQIGNQPNQPFVYVYNEASYTASGFVAYKFRLRNKPVSLQLNVENLLDWNRPVYSSTTIYQKDTASPLVAYRNAYNYVAPRNFVLSMKFDL